MDYIALRDIPSLGIKKGKIFFNENDPIFNNKELFDVWIDPQYCIHENTPVCIEGRVWRRGDLSDMRSNRLKKQHTNIPQLLGDIIKISKTNDKYEIYVRCSDGIIYSVESGSLDIRALENGNSDKSMRFKLAISNIYWFINSDGKVCSAIEGRDPYRDAWLRDVGLRFPTKDMADAARMDIRMGMRKVMPCKADD